jgi:hypothetical protein
LLGLLVEPSLAVWPGDSCFHIRSHRHEPDSAHIAYRAGLAFRHLAAAARVLASRLGFVSRIVHRHGPHRRPPPGAAFQPVAGGDDLAGRACAALIARQRAIVVMLQWLAASLSLWGRKRKEEKKEISLVFFSFFFFFSISWVRCIPQACRGLGCRKARHRALILSGCRMGVAFKIVARHTHPLEHDSAPSVLAGLFLH